MRPPVPAAGAPVALQAPRIGRPTGPPRVSSGAWSPALVVSDDGPLRHVVVWLDGVKVGYFPGGGSTLALAPSLDLSPGAHRITVVAMDDQPLIGRRTLQVLAEGPSTVDAGDVDPGGGR